MSESLWTHSIIFISVRYNYRVYRQFLGILNGTNCAPFAADFLGGSERDYYDLISEFQVGLKSLLRQGLSEPEFYGDLVYKLKKIVSSNIFSAQFIKIISH